MDFLNHLVSEINSVLWGVFCLIPLLCYDLDRKVWAIIDQNKINIYNKETTRLIKRAV